MFKNNQKHQNNTISPNNLNQQIVENSQLNNNQIKNKTNMNFMNIEKTEKSPSF